LVWVGLVWSSLVCFVLFFFVFFFHDKSGGAERLGHAEPDEGGEQPWMRQVVREVHNFLDGTPVRYGTSAGGALCQFCSSDGEPRVAETVVRTLERVRPPTAFLCLFERGWRSERTGKGKEGWEGER
jgi:hypothetical protein